MRKVTFRDEAAWNAKVEENRDPFREGVIAFCEKWAALMEERISAGVSLEDCADETSDEADTFGLSGAAYDAAVALLAANWIHGDALRRWHNQQTGSEDEAEAADAEGAVLSGSSFTIIPGR